MPQEIDVSGFKEHETTLPVDPATIKPRTKDTNGFVKYVNNARCNVSYEMASKDVYERKVKEVT